MRESESTLRHTNTIWSQYYSLNLHVKTSMITDVTLDIYLNKVMQIHKKIQAKNVAYISSHSTTKL